MPTPSLRGRYFTFQVINVFLVTTIAGSVIDCLKDIYYDPASAFYLLGNSLPKVSHAWGELSSLQWVAQFCSVCLRSISQTRCGDLALT